MAQVLSKSRHSVEIRQGLIRALLVSCHCFGYTLSLPIGFTLKLPAEWVQQFEVQGHNDSIRGREVISKQLQFCFPRSFQQTALCVLLY